MEGPSPRPLVVGRYSLHDRIASGGMAAVYIGRLEGPVGFGRTVAFKRLHPQYAADRNVATMFVDEARLASRIHHPNVVQTLDVVAAGGEFFLVMEYVRGESASALVRLSNDRREPMPPRIVASIVSGALQGLHAAHEACDEQGKPLELVHRDVSPQNILVGADGTPRVLDFGIAKAEGTFHSTRGAEIKGKIVYMSPEQLEGDRLDRTTDLYAMGLVLFELLTGRRMFQKGPDQAASIGKILRNEIALPSAFNASLAAWDRIVAQATAKLPSQRYPTARAMALEVQAAIDVASPLDIADYVERLAGDTIRERARRIAEIESGASVDRHHAQAELVKALDSPAEGPPPDPSSGSPIQGAKGEAGTQASLTLSDPYAGKRAKTRRRTSLLLVALGGGALALALLFRNGLLRRSPSTPVAAEAPTSPAATVAPSQTSADTVPTISSSAAVPADSSHAAPARSPPTRPPGRTGPSKPAKPNCSPPYIVDSAGHMHFRPECL